MTGPKGQIGKRASRRARGAAKEAIGKLLGDDAAVRAGRRDQDAAIPNAGDAQGE